jgi:hypothetical protein
LIAESVVVAGVGKMLMVEREAKLFEVGRYPDRGIDVTEADLDVIAANTVDCPIRIEHSDTPFDGALGVLKSCFRRGGELFGKLCFTVEAWALVCASDAKRLSVAILKDKSRIAEVSLVREPRIADAAVFSSDLVAEFFSDEGGSGMSAVNAELERIKQEAVEEGKKLGLAEAQAQFSATENAASVKLQEVLRENRVKDSDALIVGFKAAGKLPPAAEELVRGMLVDGTGLVVFSNGGKLSVRDAVVQLFTILPACVEVEGVKFKKDDLVLPDGATDLLDALGVTAEDVAASEKGAVG